MSVTHAQEFQKRVDSLSRSNPKSFQKLTDTLSSLENCKDELTKINDNYERLNEKSLSVSH